MAESRAGWLWHRIRRGWRCKLGIHRWKGYHDLGDGVNVQPVSGYRRPRGIRDFRTCTWCGKHHIVTAIYDLGGRSRVLKWAARG